jgi:hypothetical protein
MSSSPSQAENWRVSCGQVAPHALTIGPIRAESSPCRSERSSAASHRSDAYGEQLGVSVQLCLPGLSQTGTGILWPHDPHPGWWQRTDHADYGQRPDNSDWPPAYQFCDRGPCSPSLMCFFPCWWWETQHWLSLWFLWDKTIERRQVPLPYQHRCFCSYTPIFSKDGCDKPLASSSSEWAYA